MNTTNIKKYAPQARNDFISAMRKQAAKYGITAEQILPAEQKGDLLLIGDRANSNMRCDSLKSLMIINKLSKFL